MNIRKLGVPVPGEHGAWAVLYASFVVGWAAAGADLDLRIAILLTTITGLFLAHEPLIKILRSRKHGAPEQNRRHWLAWLGIYLSMAFVGGGILLLFYRLWLLLAIGLAAAILFSVHLHLAFRRRDRSLAGEILGVMGLTLAAPIAGITAESHGAVQTLLVWASCGLYFSSGIFYVKMRVSQHLKPGHFPIRRFQCLAYHTVLLVLLMIASATLHLPVLALLGFVPIILRAFWHALRPAGSLDLKEIGYREVFYTVIFTVTSGAGWIMVS